MVAKQHRRKKDTNTATAVVLKKPDHDDSDKSVWVVRTMETRAYCLDHKLDEGVKLCEELVGVLVASKPKKTIIVKEG